MLPSLLRQIRHYNRDFNSNPEESILIILLCLISILFSCKQEKAEKELVAYERELSSLRNEFGGATNMPDIKFFLFGMGNRPKMIYKNGVLKYVQEGKIIEKWDVSECLISPSEYTVNLRLKNGTMVSVYENENGVWINEAGKKAMIKGTSEHVILPEFNNYRYGRILKVLHHEILINILDSKPLPNFIVYNNPWRRDGALMAMCLNITGNINLIKRWVLSLDDPFDRHAP